MTGYKSKKAAARDKLAQPAQERCCYHDSDCAVHNMPAYPAGPCDCTQQFKFWSVTGKYERQAFASLSGAEAYCKGLNTTYPEGNYVVQPLSETPPAPQEKQSCDKRPWVGLTDEEVCEDKALKLALEWAEAHGEIVFAGGGMDAVNKMNSWVVAIKEALAQPEQEPADDVRGFLAARLTCWYRLTEKESDELLALFEIKTPQCTWVGLTDEDWKEIEDMPDTFDQGVVWCLAKLKGKNT